MLTLASPAKINLFLRVLHRREDGFHELASLFQTVDLCDTLHFRLTHSHHDHLTCTDTTLPTDHNNLIIKAADLFRRKTGIKHGLEVYLEKRIPQQAGLGGGSSNAATTLWAFNHLCGKPASDAQLAEWAAEIGSDIAFFLSEGTAYCTGRGEQLQSLPPLPPTYLWIVMPPKGLSTPQIYGKLNSAQLPQRDPQAALNSFMTPHPVYFNDLEIPAFEVMPELLGLKANLYDSGFKTVLMSGSGSSFFCIGDGVIPRQPGYLACSAQFINRKPNHWY